MVETGTTYGSTAIYLCDRGYRLQGGHREIRCTEIGWGGPVPSCIAVGECSLDDTL